MNANVGDIPALSDYGDYGVFGDWGPEAYAEYLRLNRGKWLTEIGLESSVIAVNLLCFILSFFYCPKLVHIILTCKVATLTINNLISIYVAKTLFAVGMEGAEKVELTVSEEDEFVVGQDPEHVMYALDGAFFFLSQCYTLVLLRELYLITCKMTPRQPSTPAILAKCGVAIVVGVLLVAADHLIPVYAMANTLTAHILAGVTPITTLAVLVLTLVDAWLVSRILVALRKNNRFKRECQAQTNGSLGFLTGIVVLLMTSQVTRLVLHLVRVILYPQSIARFSDCLEGGVEDMVCGESHHRNLVKMKIYFRVTLFYAIEHVLFCFVMIYKQFREKRRAE